MFEQQAGADELESLGLDVLAATVRASEDAIAVLDGVGRVVYASPAFCQLLGHPCERLLGQDAFALYPERDRQSVRTFRTGAREGGSEPAVRVFYRPDGSELEIEVRATVLDHQGRRFFVAAVRDVTERQRQAHRAAALAQAAASIAAGGSIDGVLEAISECALAGTRALAAWVTLDDEDDVAAWVGTAGVPDGLGARLRPAAAMAAACPTFTQALSAQRVLVYTDARQQLERELATAGVADALRSLPWQSAAFAPLLHGGVVVGVLTALYREGEQPHQAETTFLAALADQAVMAAVHARLLVAAREKVALEERQRLARELHDSIYQSLFAIQLGAATARERLEQEPARVAQPIDYIRRLAEASQAEMRALIFALRPEALEAEGLVAALNSRVEALRARQGIRARVAAGAEPELSLEVKLALYRIGREALWNVLKHARARHVEVRLEADGDWAVLEVADDGVGFDAGGGFPGHLGQCSMRECAIGVGGSLEVVSARGHGTRVVVRVPLQRPRGRTSPG